MLEVSTNSQESFPAECFSQTRPGETGSLQYEKEARKLQCSARACCFSLRFSVLSLQSSTLRHRDIRRARHSWHGRGVDAQQIPTAPTAQLQRHSSNSWQQLPGMPLGRSGRPVGRQVIHANKDKQQETKHPDSLCSLRVSSGIPGSLPAGGLGGVWLCRLTMHTLYASTRSMHKRCIGLLTKQIVVCNDGRQPDQQPADRPPSLSPSETLAQWRSGGEAAEKPASARPLGLRRCLFLE